MIVLTLAEIAELSDGTVSHADAASPVFGPVVADSRRVRAGALFVAVPGARVDGHAYAADAVAAGAVGVLASRDVGVPAVLVDDPVLGLGRLAHGYLGKLTDARVVGVTGSSGKTSTKDILGQLLGELGATVAPEGSFNTEVGLPLTVLRADADTRFLVLEYSARGLGHIAYLCGIARPDVAVVLNVGAAHLGEFGSTDVVARAKRELVEALPADGLAVLNADDLVVERMRARTAARVVTFGIHRDADVRATGVRLDELARPTFRLVAAGAEVEVALQLHGAHQVSNALAAVAVGLEVGAELGDIGDALGRVRPISAWRMQVTTRPDGLTVVNDAYNANPDSMRAALSALVAMGSHRRTWAVLGAMAELGPTSRQAHVELGAQAARLGVRRLVVVGPAAAAIGEGARSAGFDPAALAVVADVAEALGALEAGLRPDDVVLVKASRSADLQRVAEALLAMTTSSAAPQAGR